MKNQCPSEVLQPLITSGRKVLLSNDGRLLNVKIRYNTHDTDGETKWRLIVDGVEYLAKEVVNNTVTSTISEEMPSVGLKHHLQSNCKEVLFQNNIATIN